ENKSFWDFLCGRVTEIVVRVETLPLDKGLIGDYAEDAQFRERFQTWINTLWAEKDRLLTELKARDVTGAGVRPTL
ncbi:MAG TPA: hypothetical protein PLB81_10675, partial [Deltaproteobacteria bacterium]|nr:hypothetical protein [Deltaproteobacteria bacterium]